MYKKIKKWYVQGLWTAEMVQNAVGKLLTQEEVDAIVGGVGVYG